jgi:hypothetical protein
MRESDRWKELWPTFGHAPLANPVGFLFGFRWLTYILAVGIVYSDSAADVNLFELLYGDQEGPPSKVVVGIAPW